MDVVTLDRQALASTGRLVHCLQPGQLGRPTPCSGWDVGALLNHVIGGNIMFAAAARGEPPDWGHREIDRVGDDPVPPYEASVDEITWAFGQDGATERSFALPFGTVPGRWAMGVHFVDVLVHGWDLAIATGQPAALDDGLCEAAIEIVQTYPPESWGDPRFFAERVDLPGSASAPHRLVALVGRNPRGEAQ